MPKKSIFDRYERYDTSQGFGNPDEWRSAFTGVIGNTYSIEDARQILGVSRNSSQEEIKSSYRNLARRHHPDKCGGSDTAFHKIQKAYEVLTSRIINPMPVIMETSRPIRPTTTTTSGVLPQLLNEIYENEIEKYLSDPRYCAQEKHDGRRRIIKHLNNNNLAFNKKGISSSTTDEINNECNELARNNNIQEFVIDGEEVNDKYYVFDILSLNLQDLRLQTYTERINANFINVSNKIEFVYTAYTETEKRNLFQKLKSENKEGIVFKLLSGTHKSGYSDEHVKFKFYSSASVIIYRHNERNSVGIAIYTPQGLHPIGNVSMIGHTRHALGTVIEVKYLYACRGGSLYQANYLGLRDDVNQEDCTIEKLKFKGE